MSLRPQSRVAVASDQSLVSEAVREALTNRGFDVVTLVWPTPEPVVEEAAAPAAARVPRPRAAVPDVGLVISDLDRPGRVEGARRIVKGLPVRWLVLTGAPRGAMWGAVLDAGAHLVLPSTTSLEQVVSLLPAVVSGRRRTTGRQRRLLVHEWHVLRSEQESVAAALEMMTPRESEVLRLLYAGESVNGIALRFAVSEATVRSQVKAVLRKLDVNSQLAAVAAYGSLQQG